MRFNNHFMAERQTRKSKLYLANLFLTTLTALKRLILTATLTAVILKLSLVIYFTNLGG
jgi:hypothetical protein